MITAIRAIDAVRLNHEILIITAACPMQSVANAIELQQALVGVAFGTFQRRSSDWCDRHPFVLTTKTERLTRNVRIVRFFLPKRQNRIHVLACGCLEP